MTTPRSVFDQLLKLYREQLAAAAKAGTSVTLVVPGDEADELRRLLEGGGQAFSLTPLGNRQPPRRRGIRGE